MHDSQKMSYGTTRNVWYGTGSQYDSYRTGGGGSLPISSDRGTAPTMLSLMRQRHFWLKMTMLAASLLSWAILA